MSKILLNYKIKKKIYIANNATTQIPLADIVLFGLFPLTLSPQGFKTRLLGEGFHTLINGDLFNTVTTEIPLADIVLFGLFPLRLSPQRFKSSLLGEGFHTLINGDLFSSPTNVWHHNPPPPSLPSVLAGTLSFLQSMWDHLQIHPLWDPASLVAHRLVSTPFGEEREGWHIVRCLALIPFVTTQIHR